MKKLILLLFIPLVFTCSDDSDNVDEPIAVGDIHEGGMVYSVNTAGAGMVVTAQDIGHGNWAEANQMAENNMTGGYDDWYLPSTSQLQQIYNSIGQGGGNIGGFDLTQYWGSNHHTFNFSTGQEFGLNDVLNARVRAVRSFD